MQAPTYTTLTINLNNIDEIVATDYRRKIRQRAQEDLTAILEREQQFKNPVHLNQVDGKYRIIDGNHRIEAVKKYLERHPSASIQLGVALYSDLTVDEEKELYDALAKTVSQTVGDILKIHFDDVPIMGWIANDFPIPVSIYSTQQALSYANLFTMWSYRERDEYASVRRGQIVDYAKSISRKDFMEMKEFFRQFKQIFGEPQTTSPYYKLGPLWIIATLYFRNHGVTGDDRTWERIRSCCFDNLILLSASRTHQREPTIDARRMILEKMNSGWRGNKFI